MLFNSQVFIFLFLPLCLLVTYAAAKLGGRGAGKVALILMSLAFYAYWRIDHLWIIVMSITVNYLGIRLLTGLSSHNLRRLGLATLVSFNLILIGSYKYLNFLFDTLSSLTGTSIELAQVALPLGISFFSFQQIAYIVDYYRGGRRDDRFVDYSLAVLFFPHLIAGPLVKYRSLIDQFSPLSTPTRADAVTTDDAPSEALPIKGASAAVKTRSVLFQPTSIGIAIGISIFAIGLFKKVVFADNFAAYANPIFDAAEQNVALAFSDAWIGAVSFFFQIYYDFSGYTDMAIGLALMFGIALPVNFLSPYTSRSIIEFWRRWHITLSSFLRDYVYISLGGNRYGVARRHMNLLITMLIGGLWHGASWTFVAWGGLHGLFLIINHMYNRVRSAVPLASHAPERWFYQAITLLAVMLTWVYFRAETFTGAHALFAEMLNIGDGGAGTLLTYERMASTLPGQFSRAFFEFGLPTFGPKTIWLGFAVFASVLTLFWPNTYELFSKYSEAEASVPDSLRTRPLINVRWSPSLPWMLVTAGMFAVGLLSMTQVAQFIYFEF